MAIKLENSVSDLENVVETVLESYGGINDMSVLDPLPGLVGFRKVVSMSVHPSPLKPQLPVDYKYS